MIRNLVIVLLPAAIAATATAGAPRTPPLQTYSVLWTQSPFTSKPEVEATAPVAEANPFEDWALGGVSNFGGRYLVTLFHRKEANRQMIVDESDKAGEFQVVEVKQQDDYKQTQVVIASGGKKGDVVYDEKVIASRTAAAAKNQQAQAQAAAHARAQPQLPPGVQPPDASGRPPRMRVIPAAPQANQPNQPNQANQHNQPSAARGAPPVSSGGGGRSHGQGSRR
jgi:hypothetical protein